MTTDEQRLERLEDIEAIQQLRQDYCKHADFGWSGAEPDAGKVARLFTEEAEWSNGLGVSLRRPDQIERWFAGSDHADPGGLAVHLAINPLITVSGDAANGEWHGLIALTRKGRAYWCVGKYFDTYQRCSDGWRFASMKFSPAFVTPYEDGWAKTRFADLQYQGLAGLPGLSDPS